jgi:transposase
MDKHLHKRASEDFVVNILKKYLAKDMSLKQVLEILKIKKSRFYDLFNHFKSNPESFSISYVRKTNKRISAELENIILSELEKEKKLIENKDIPIRDYNYSFIKDQIYKNFKQKVSTPTIISRAKLNNYYIQKKEYKKHDREVLTNYPGELIQHDSSFHQVSPYADKKWYLITSLDDFSRYLLYAELLEKETSWAHIQSLESVFLNFGIPLAYYTDCHSIFRYVRGRDSFYYDYNKVTDDSDPQFKQILNDLNVELKYALSPQAKGKIERPYQWLQDRLVRTCAREGIKSITDAKKILRYEVSRYNNHQVHSTTKEIPAIRFNESIKNQKTCLENLSCLNHSKIQKIYFA